MQEAAKWSPGCLCHPSATSTWDLRLMKFACFHGDTSNPLGLPHQPPEVVSSTPPWDRLHVQASLLWQHLPFATPRWQSLQETCQPLTCAKIESVATILKDCCLYCTFGPWNLQWHLKRCPGGLLCHVDSLYQCNFQQGSFSSLSHPILQLPTGHLQFRLLECKTLYIRLPAIRGKIRGRSPQFLCSLPGNLTMSAVSSFPEIPMV